MHLRDILLYNRVESESSAKPRELWVAMSGIIYMSTSVCLDAHVILYFSIMAGRLSPDLPEYVNGETPLYGLIIRYPNFYRST